MRIAFAFGLTVALSSAALAQPASNNNVSVPAAPAVAPAAVPVQPANPLAPAIAAPAAQPVTPNILSASDVSLYKQAFAAARAGQLIKARALVAKVSDSALAGYVEAAAILATKHPARDTLVKWLSQYRDLSVADRIYRLAVSRASKKVRRGHKLITVAVVTNIPAPVSVGRRTGGYEDAEIPEPTPSSEAARAVMTKILADIKAGTPDKSLARLNVLETAGMAPSDDIAILSHRIALSYLAEGM